MVDPAPNYQYDVAAVAASPSPAGVIEITPLHDRIDFLSGSLGSQPSTAFLEGEIQIKLAGSVDSNSLRERGGAGAAEDRTHDSFDKLVVCFRGVERRQVGERVEEIELCETTMVLWGLGVPSSSRSEYTGEAVLSALQADWSPSSSSSSYPTSTRFKIPLTSDIQHCIHLPTSSLEYTLSATLRGMFTSTASPTSLHCSVPVHLARSAPPLPLQRSSPIGLSISDPLPISIRLAKSTYQRSDSIKLVVRIEIPSMEVRSRGLRLRKISAELRRKVVVGDRTPLSRNAFNVEDEIQEIRLLPDEPLYSVVARSGKSCRFSAVKPIVIRLCLHPPLVESICESVTQSTLLHDVSFEVRVSIGLFTNEGTTPVDCSVTQQIIILPDPPSTTTSATSRMLRPEKQRQDSADLIPVPSYLEDLNAASTSYTLSDAKSSTVHDGDDVDELAEEGEVMKGGDSQEAIIPTMIDDDDDYGEEFDGYEEVSFSASTRIPPPTIDEDVSPPSHHAGTSLDLAPNPTAVNHEDDPSQVLTTLSQLQIDTSHVATVYPSSSSAIPYDSSPYSAAPALTRGDRSDEFSPPPYIGGVIGATLSAAVVLNGPPPYES